MWCLDVCPLDCQTVSIAFAFSASRRPTNSNLFQSHIAFWHRTIQINENWLVSLAKLTAKGKNEPMESADVPINECFLVFSTLHLDRALAARSAYLGACSRRNGTCRANPLETWLEMDRRTSVTFQIWGFRIAAMSPLTASWTFSIHSHRICQRTERDSNELLFLCLFNFRQLVGLIWPLSSSPPPLRCSRRFFLLVTAAFNSI